MSVRKYIRRLVEGPPPPNEVAEQAAVDQLLTALNELTGGDARLDEDEQQCDAASND